MKNLVLVFVLFLTLVCCTSEADRNRMDALLDRADSMNRTYIPMTDGIDSLLLEATRYYDRHGDANQQVRAHYLLGCAYRDMGEAPAALQSYQNAVDHADTMSSDCDYRRLMSVYGQMAELFHAQNLPSDEFAQKEKYGKYALLIGDTLLYIRNLELYVKPYFLMGDTMGMLKVVQQAHDLYLSHGFTREASGVYGPVIDYYISKGQLDEARKLMKEYEEQSGLFDADGNIVPSREIYYYIQGSYYLMRNDLPNAERCFRKLPANYQKDAYKGLLSVFRLKGDFDSIAKYAYLYETTLDTLHNQMRTDVVHQMSSMYNYQRFQLKAEKEERAAERTKVAIIFIIIGFVLLSSLFLFLLRRYRHKKQSEILRLSTDYERAVSDYETACEENELLRQSGKDIIESKTQEIASLRELVSQYEQQWKKVKQHDKEEALINSDLVCTFCDMAIGKLGSRIPTNAEWKHLFRLFMQSMPVAHTIISKDDKLSNLEMKTCVLTLLKFKNSDIAVLLKEKPQRITNMKSRINKKLFGVESASTLQENLQRLISTGRFEF